MSLLGSVLFSAGVQSQERQQKSDSKLSYQQFPPLQESSVSSPLLSSAPLSYPPSLAGFFQRSCFHRYTVKGSKGREQEGL